MNLIKYLWNNIAKLLNTDILFDMEYKSKWFSIYFCIKMFFFFFGANVNFSVHLWEPLKLWTPLNSGSPKSKKKKARSLLFTQSHQCFKPIWPFYSVENKDKMLNKFTKNKKLVTLYTQLQLMGTRAFKPHKNAMLQKRKHKVIVKFLKLITLMLYIPYLLSDF